MHPLIKEIQAIREEIGRLNTDVFHIQELKAEFFVAWAEIKAILHDKEDPPTVDESTDLSYELTDINLFIEDCDNRIGNLEGKRALLLSKLEDFGKDTLY